MTDSSGNDRKTSRLTTPRYVVPALDKGLEILEMLSDTAVSMSQADIARAVGRNVSEIFRTLSALEARGYIRRTQAGQYRLTLKLFELSRTHSPYEELLRVAQPVMHELSETLGETCHLTTMRDGEIVVLAQSEAPRAVRLSVEIGSRHSPLRTTSGRILLAAMDEDTRMAFLHGYTEFASLAATEKAVFLARVETISKRGFEIADGERFVGGLDVGVLVGTPRSVIKAALIVATLKGAQNGPDPERLCAAVMKAALRITQIAGISQVDNP
ncbi:IclR family transcriptional regulator [Shinella sp. 838]|uniref:IclR family transcriptional regulator n=1 Tax=Shinella sp. 838 TaxID=3038164 RepID=UPI00241522A5|nr:IclR family transcriptional regulator [Shinella sp. 838]MDG4674910.1 IclR family transcriptional regulator [Shinella sp. 838]